MFPKIRNAVGENNVCNSIIFLLKGNSSACRIGQLPELADNSSDDI